MKLKKALLFTSMIPLLVSCNSGSIAGRYGFQLGKDNGTHFGIYLNLKDSAYIGDNTYKDFTLDVSVSFPDQDSEDTMNILADIFRYLGDGENGKVSIPGFYKLTDETNKQGEKRVRLGIGFDYIYEKLSKYVEETKQQTIDEASREEINKLNDSDLLQALLYATYKDDTVNAYIPVSMQDVYYQLYWSGYDLAVNIPTSSTDDGDSSITPNPRVQFEETDPEGQSGEGEGDDSEENIKIDVLPVTPHPAGSHPTKEEIDEINKTFEQDHADSSLLLFLGISNFRDYNVVKMGLSKR
ncbi:MAG: hypothetical protein J6M95_02360 [Bacilli bacterium]|nr:hypothetical protein [Bacilli bacterium]